MWGIAVRSTEPERCSGDNFRGARPLFLIGCRVEIAAASVNPVDLAVAGGFFHGLGLIDQPEHTGLGWDFAGTVAAVGPGSGPGADLAVGTRVAGLVTGFDRDFGTYAEQSVVPVADLAVVPDGVDLVGAATVPLNGLTAAGIVDLLGDAPTGGDRLLVTGAAGAVGGYVLSLARDRGWKVTGLARGADEGFVRGLGADFTVEASPGWDAVVDTATLKEQGLAPVRDGGRFVGVLPGGGPDPERGITVAPVEVASDGPRLAELLARAASGELSGGGGGRWSRNRGRRAARGGCASRRMRPAGGPRGPRDGARA